MLGFNYTVAILGFLFALAVIQIPDDKLKKFLETVLTTVVVIGGLLFHFWLHVVLVVGIIGVVASACR